jgi:hypothetical protein
MKTEDIYVIAKDAVTDDGKREFYKHANPFPLNDMFEDRVHCLHCDAEFDFKEFTPVIARHYGGGPMVFCKNFPKCDGTIIDFFDAEGWVDSECVALFR